MSGGEMARLAAFGLAGLLLGAASLAALRRNVADYLGGRAWRSIGAHVARLAILAAILVWTARQGAGPLLALAAGLVLARPIALRVMGRAP
jgi:hypothetical protein